MVRRVRLREFRLAQALEDFELGLPAVDNLRPLNVCHEAPMHCFSRAVSLDI